MPDFVVSTAFRVSDEKITGTFERMSKAADRFGNRSVNAFKRGRKEASLFKTLTSSILVSRAITAGTSAMTRGIRTVTEEFINFDSSIGRAAAKFPTRIKRGTAAFDALEAAAREVGATTEFTAAQAAESLEEYAKAGIDAETAMGLLAGTAELATNSQLGMAEATSISLDALDIFELRTKDAATNVANLARVNDTLTSVVNSAKLDMVDFSETLKFTGPVANTVGASLEDVAAATGLVAKAGIRGSLAGTALKNTYLGLASQTPKAQKVLKDLGVQAIDPVTGDLRDMLDVLAEFSAATEDMGNAQRAASIETVFGLRAVSAVSKIMALGSDEIENYRDRLNESKGASAAMADEIRQSLENRLKSLQSAAIEVGFKILEAFRDDGKEGIDALTAAVREFDPKPVVEAIRELVDGLKWLFRTVRDNWTLIKTLAGAFVALKIAMAGISFVNAISGAMQFAKAAGLAHKAGSLLAKTKVPVGPGAPAAGGAGVAGQVAAVGAAGAVGFGIGSIIEEFWLNPMRQEGERFRVGLENLNQRIDLERLQGFEKLSQAELATRILQLQASLKDVPPAVTSLEGAWEHVKAVFTGDDTPFDKQREQLERSAELHRQLAAALMQARDAAARQAAATRAAGQVDVNVNVGNAPPGTTVEAESRGNAPPVNTSQAGKV